MYYPGTDQLSRQLSRHRGRMSADRSNAPTEHEAHGAIESQRNSETTKDQKLNFGVQVANDESHLGWGQERNWGLNSQGRKGY